ncbi:hypothetical protein ADUPG1_012904, partial [Aduncisulcus paluster]
CVTHAHLDHSGGAGRLAQEFPRAKVICHPSCAPHLIDPSRLVHSAAAVYGKENMHSLYGEVIPIKHSQIIVPRQSVQILGDDGMVVLDTPGHAFHHSSFIIDKAAFVGDVCGTNSKSLFWRDLDVFDELSKKRYKSSSLKQWMKKSDISSLKYESLCHFTHKFCPGIPISSPTQFSAEDWRKSVELLLLRDDVDWLCPTHFEPMFIGPDSTEYGIDVRSRLMSLWTDVLDLYTNIIKTSQPGNSMKHVGGKVLSGITEVLMKHDLQISDFAKWSENAFAIGTAGLLHRINKK